MPLAPVDSAQGAINVVAFSARREVALLRSRPWDLAMITWVPALACLLLWWIFSAGLPTRLPIGLVDDDHSALSRQLTRFLDATPGLAVAVRYANAAEAERAGGQLLGDRGGREFHLGGPGQRHRRRAALA